MLFGGAPTLRSDGWPLTLTLLLAAVCGWFTLNGWFMNENELNVYKPEACIIGKFLMPPLMSPITWFRVIILAVATISAATYPHHARSR